MIFSAYIFAKSESTIERTSIMENTIKKICAVLSFRVPLVDLLFFKFLLAIF